jgi:hypothetical protein
MTIPVGPIRAIRPSTAALTKSHLAQLICSVDHGLLLGRDLARDGDVTRWDVHDWVVGEEVARAQQEGHGLDGHDGEVLWGWDVSHSKGVPQDKVRVLDGLAAVTDPLGQAARGLP